MSSPFGCFCDKMLILFTLVSLSVSICNNTIIDKLIIVLLCPWWFTWDVYCNTKFELLDSRLFGLPFQNLMILFLQPRTIKHQCFFYYFHSSCLNVDLRVTNSEPFHNFFLEYTSYILYAINFLNG